MIKLRHFVISFCLVTPAFAQDQCDQDSLDGLQLCIDSCQEEVPGCQLEVSNPIDDIILSVEDRCVFDASGQPRPEQRCKVCVNSAIKDLANGSSKLLGPIVKDMKRQLVDLKDSCGKPLDDGEDDSGGFFPPSPGGEAEGGGGGAGK